jgi:polar amino acid transport system substrate-binding protein
LIRAFEEESDKADHKKSRGLIMFPQRNRIFFVPVAIVLMILSCDVTAFAKTDSILTIGYREDAPPFSYETEEGNPTGYSIDICKEISKEAINNGLFDRSAFIRVSADSRFKDLHEGKIDLLCEATTVTIKRIQDFRPSFFTFISGASFMYNPDNGNIRCEEFLSKKIGVLRGTTTKNEIVDIIKSQCEGLQKKREVSEVIHLEQLASHQDSINALVNDKIDIYYADRDILLYYRTKARSQNFNLSVSRRYFTNEPYAVFMRLDDNDLHFIANKTIVALCRNGEINNIFRRHFTGYLMSQPLKNLYQLLKLLDGPKPL